MASFLLQIRGNIVLNSIARAVDLIDQYGVLGDMEQSDCYFSLLTDLAHYAKAGERDLLKDVAQALDVALDEEFVAYGAPYDPQLAGHD